MKIAFISFYSGKVNRGVESFVHELATNLAKTNEATLYQSGLPREDVNYKIIRHDIKVDWNKPDTSDTFMARVLLDYWRILILRFSVLVARDIVREKYDIVIPLNGGWMSMVMRVVTLFSKTKMILVGESGIGWDDRFNLYTFPDRFVAISSYAQNWAKKTNRLVKSVYIPNGVDTKKFNPNGEKLDTGFNGKTILCVGALVPSKRIDLVIRAVSQLKNVNLLIVGDGDEKDNLNKMGLELIGKDRFKIMKLKFEDMPKVYRSADLFTLTSESYYAFEIVLIEAMASGLAVVANDDPIRREIVGDAGYYINPEDSNEYAKSLHEALNRQWGDVPCMQAKKFDWSIVSQKYEKLFDDITYGHK